MFKEAYCRQMEQITPDASFLQQLSDRMEQENGKREITKRRARNRYVWGTVAAAAALVLGIGLFWNINSRYRAENDNLIRQNAGGVVEKEESGEHIFAGSTWYGEETDPEKIYHTLTEMLEGGQNVAITASGQADFAEASGLSDTEKADVITLLEQGQYVGSYEEESGLLSGEPVYYLAEFADGTAVKFAVYEGQYFYCSEIDGIFRLQP